MKLIFEVDKKQFKVFIFALKYNFQIQIYLVFVLIGLHNFIKNYLYRQPNYFEKEKAFIYQNIIANSSFVGNSLTTSTSHELKKKKNFK